MCVSVSVSRPLSAPRCCPSPPRPVHHRHRTPMCWPLRLWARSFLFVFVYMSLFLSSCVVVCSLLLFHSCCVVVMLTSTASSQAADCVRICRSEHEEACYECAKGPRNRLGGVKRACRLGDCANGSLYAFDIDIFILGFIFVAW